MPSIDIQARVISVLLGRFRVRMPSAQAFFAHIAPSSDPRKGMASASTKELQYLKPMLEKKKEISAIRTRRSQDLNPILRNHCV